MTSVSGAKITKHVFFFDIFSAHRVPFRVIDETKHGAKKSQRAEPFSDRLGLELLQILDRIIPIVKCS